MSGYPQSEESVERARFEAASQSSRVQEALCEINRIKLYAQEVSELDKVVPDLELDCIEEKNLNDFIQKEFGEMAFHKPLQLTEKLKNLEENMSSCVLTEAEKACFRGIVQAQKRYNNAVQAALDEVIRKQLNEFLEKVKTAQNFSEEKFKASIAEPFTNALKKLSEKTEREKYKAAIIQAVKNLKEEKKATKARNGSASASPSVASSTPVSVSSASPSLMSDAAPRPVEHWLIKLLEEKAIVPDSCLEVIKTCEAPPEGLLLLVTELLKNAGDSSIDLERFETDLRSQPITNAFNQWRADNQVALNNIQNVLLGTLLQSCLEAGGNFAQVVLNQIKRPSPVSVSPTPSPHSVTPPANSSEPLFTMTQMMFNSGGTGRVVVLEQRGPDDFLEPVPTGVPIPQAVNIEVQQPENYSQRFGLKEGNIGDQKIVELLNIVLRQKRFHEENRVLSHRRDPISHGLFRCCAQTNSMKCGKALALVFSSTGKPGLENQLAAARQEAMDLFRKVLKRSMKADKTNTNKEAISRAFQSALEKI